MQRFTLIYLFDGKAHGLELGLPISAMTSGWVKTKRVGHPWDMKNAPYGHFWVPKDLKIGDEIDVGEGGSLFRTWRVEDLDSKNLLLWPIYSKEKNQQATYRVGNGE